MHPILFEIPGLSLPLRSFGVMVAGGFLLGMWIMGRLVQRYSEEPERDLARYSVVHVWILAGVLIGARLMYVIVEIAKGSTTGQEYLDAPWSVLFIWQGGLVMYGGLFGGILFGVWKGWKEKLDIPHGLDTGLTAGFFGLAVGRVGCLLVGDDYGKHVPPAYEHLPFPITLTVPVELPTGSLFGAQNAGQVLWATQPWMAVNAVLIGLLGVWLLKHRRFPGQVSLVLALVYSITRFVIERFRGDELRGMWFEGALSTSQLVAIGVATVSVLLLIRAGLRGAPAPQT